MSKWKGLDNPKWTLLSDVYTDGDGDLVALVKTTGGDIRTGFWKQDGMCWAYSSCPANLVPSEQWVKGTDLKPGMYVNAFRGEPGLECHLGFASLVATLDRGYGPELVRLKRNGFEIDSAIGPDEYHVVTEGNGA